LMAVAPATAHTIFTRSGLLLLLVTLMVQL
jgi:hypothetical protein